MKKILSILLVLICVCTAFGATVKPYLATLDLHPGILGGWFPTYAGVGVDAAFPLANGDTLHADYSMAGGITERALFQNAKTGDYVEIGKSEVELMDVISLNWDLKGTYDFGKYLHFSLGYFGMFESRKDSMFVTGKCFPKGLSSKRWIGGAEKETPTLGVEEWLNQFDAEDVTAVYPEMGKKRSLYNTFYTEVEFNMMEDTMVANDGLLAKFKLDYASDLFNAEASLLDFNLDIIGAFKLVDIRLANGLNGFALSLIDRTNVNLTFGSKVPTYFQQSISLGRKVRGFDAGSYASTFTAVNNFEVRLSGVEPTDGVFLRTNFFFDCGIGSGKLFNTDTWLAQPNFLASVGVQEQIDYNDAFDLGIEAAYLLHGINVKHPYSKWQIGATFFLDF